MSEHETNQSNDFSTSEQNASGGMHPAFETALKYKKQILMGIGAILVLGLVIGGIRWQRASAVSSAQERLGTILLENKGEARITALETMLEDVPSAVRPAVLLELAETCMKNDLHEKAADYYGRLSDSDDDAVALIAALGQSKALIMSGKAQEAYDVLDEIAEDAPETFTAAVYRQLALAAEAAGKDEAALAAWEKLMEKPTADKNFIEYKLQQLNK
ncbi:hypothetical protein [Desulfovibrio oxyclinae]|uniref:hypothetical protein n=1 Tax=Desulfovibrio oxyclinae TaxID=63560 RepID=UPI000378B4C4|nr:hypothetical protein [Desulfovibrio oxyclinae]